jgi:hypothetical protein
MAAKSKPKSDIISDKERVDQGNILVRVVIEVLGAPKEYVEESVQAVVDKVHDTKDVEVVSESTYEAEEKGKLFCTFSEIEMWCKNTDILTQFLFNFTPSSVEVMQPTSVSMKANVLSGFFNDFLLKMHDLGLKLKNTSATNQLLQKNADTVVRNFLNSVLDEPRSLGETSKITGIPEDNIKAILSHFVKVGVVNEKDGKYVNAKKNA